MLFIAGLFITPPRIDKLFHINITNNVIYYGLSIGGMINKPAILWYLNI